MATVRVQGVDRTFETLGGESLLEAAIRAGISLPYGCASGNCGLCKARLIEGSVQKTRQHDYVLSQASRARGDFLMCSNQSDGDISIEVDVAQDVATIPMQTIQVKVRQMESVGQGLLRLQLRVPRSQRLRFMAGQYAILTLANEASSESAIASCPCDERFLEFHLRYLPDDAFSEYAFHSLRTGEMVTLHAPGGRFTFNDDSPRSAVFVAFDTGFAAIKGLLEHVTARESEIPMHLYRVCCAREDLYLDNLCRSWADALDEISYTALIIGDSYERWAADELSGLDRVTAMLSQVMDDYPDLSGHDVYACAPESVVEQFERLALNVGLMREQFRAEVIRGNSHTRCLGSIRQSGSTIFKD